MTKPRPQKSIAVLNPPPFARLQTNKKKQTMPSFIVPPKRVVGAWLERASSAHHHSHKNPLKIILTLFFWFCISFNFLPKHKRWARVRALERKRLFNRYGRWKARDVGKTDPVTDVASFQLFCVCVRALGRRMPCPNECCNPKVGKVDPAAMRRQNKRKRVSDEEGGGGVRAVEKRAEQEDVVSKCE